LISFSREHGVPVRENGLVVVATDETERERLENTLDRAEANGVEARWLEGDEVSEPEPAAEGIAGVHGPSYASFDARTYVHALTGQAVDAGAVFLYDTRVHRIEDTGQGVRVHTSKGPIRASAAVNAAGLYADRLAGDVSEDLRIVPFRGYYAEVVPAKRDMVTGHVYPTPDPELPFLGVHFSKRADGRLIVGPGAMLAFGREAYSFFEGNLHDFWDTFTWPGFYRLIAGSKIRSLISREVKKSLSLRALASEARNLVPGIEHGDLVNSYAGNRAQMVSRDGELVMDLIVRGHENTVHVLNAISPGLTCSLPFGEHLAERVQDRL
jgi:L-2-hydroxyglutarate oxidase